MNHFSDLRVPAPKKSGWLFYALLLLGLGSLWAGVGWINQRSEEQGLEEMRRETAALALLFATHADTTFRTVDLALKELRLAANKPTRVIADVTGPHLELLNGAILQVGVLDAQGMVTYSAPVAATTPTFAGDREFFTVHQQNKTDALFVGRPVKGRVSNRWSIHLSRPIFDKGKFSGVVLIAVDPDYFVNFYNRAGMGGGGAARMIRDTGEIMARSSEQEKFIGKVIKPSPYADPGAPLQGSFRRRAQVDGVDRLSSYHRLPQYGLTVVIGPSVDERLAAVRTHQRELIWAAATISILILVVSWLLRQGLLKTEAARLAIDRSEAKFRRLFESMTEGVALHKMVFDAHAHAVNYSIVDLNPAYERQTGWAYQDVVGKAITQVLSLDAAPHIGIYAEVLRSGQARQFEYRDEARKKDFIVHAFAYQPDHFATVFVDITEHRMLEALREADHQQLQTQYREILELKEQLLDQALRDPLTQLHNRRFLNESLPRELARARREGYPVALIMFDLDHFKRVNDTYGHAVGDQVLRNAALLLAEHARETDIVCRYGGEEFLLALPGMDAEQAFRRAEQIRLALSQRVITHEGDRINVTVSSGVAVFPEHGLDMATLFEAADAALYQAKQSGRDRVVIAPRKPSPPGGNP